MHFDVLSIFIGLVVGAALILLYNSATGKNAKKEAQKILDEANNQAKNTVKQAVLDGKTQVYDLKLQAEKEIKEKRSEVLDHENKLQRREDSLNFRDENLTQKERKLDEKLRKADDKAAQLDKMEEELQSRIDGQIAILERVSNMSKEEARSELMEVVESKMADEVAAFIRDKEEEAKEMAAENAREIIATAIQRYSQDETLERTVSVVSLPSEEMKGRIIGREGRNIRAIEQATGADLIIDDTPEAITVSCFDPIRREIARLSLETLIRDGRIQPGRIEDVVEKTTKEMNRNIQKYGEDACFKLQIGKIDKELVKLIGRMRYRYSYGQNGLEHSIEVASFAGMMAAELGLNQNLAKRAGLLHDIGKAVDFEQEGTHVELGAKLAKKYGERPEVINAIESHHGDVPANNLISNLVAAADTLSAARPGARYEGIENYINRLESLEKIANDFDGVDKAYAIQAGREVRVMVVPEKVDDNKCTMIARAIKERIENELTYPGQIKVTVIREMRAQETAK
ncbi:MAG: ribonuclease Y [Erysipelotrichaceae bacterium]|nr:ribonuclease Y [Erysipelotrichaceae bacterium]MBQ3994905.1 ribonuclease Y [Erysipelotrichaceae bacterium]MBQ9158226.1 ribonuclease Y [Erysipelotrichaceae bacterium]